VLVAELTFALKLVGLARLRSCVQGVELANLRRAHNEALARQKQQHEASLLALSSRKAGSSEDEQAALDQVSGALRHD
jgi:hypothetical protein